MDCFGLGQVIPRVAPVVVVPLLVVDPGLCSRKGLPIQGFFEVKKYLSSLCPENLLCSLGPLKDLCELPLWACG